MKEHVIDWEWKDHVQAGKITVKWIMKLIMWSVIIAYLPNIIWYFAGYPADAILMRCIVMAAGLPAAVFIGMRSYRMHYVNKPLDAHIWIYKDHMVADRVIMSESFREYDTIWKSAVPMIKKIELDMDSGFMTIRALYHIETYKNRRKNKQNKASKLLNTISAILVMSDFLEEELRIPVPDDKLQDLVTVLETYYKFVTEIKRKEDNKDGKKI